MQNKKTRIFLRAVLVFFAVAEFSLAAQSYYNYNSSSRRRKKNTSTVSTTQKKKTQNSRTAAQKKSSPAVAPVVNGGGTEQFDPRKPTLKAETFYNVDTRIRKELLERKFSGEIDEKERTFWVKNRPSQFLYTFQILKNNPETAEITGIHPDWFKQYERHLKDFIPITRAVRSALARQNDELYEKYLEQFQAQQKTCLDFLKTKPPKMTPEQRANLRMKNSQMRLKRYRERMKK